MTNQAFEVIEISLKSSHLPSNSKQADKRTLVIYQVCTNLSFLSGKRTSSRAYPLDPSVKAAIASILVEDVLTVCNCISIHVS